MQTSPHLQFPHPLHVLYQTTEPKNHFYDDDDVT